MYITKIPFFRLNTIKLKENYQLPRNYYFSKFGFFLTQCALTSGPNFRTSSQN